MSCTVPRCHQTVASDDKAVQVWLTLEYQTPQLHDVLRYVTNVLIFQVSSHTFRDFSIPKVIFHDFLDLENFYFKFHDFPDFQNLYKPCQWQSCASVLHIERTLSGGGRLSSTAKTWEHRKLPSWIQV